jgi:hypothetical protein
MICMLSDQWPLIFMRLRIYQIRVKVMIDSTKEKAEKEKALRKLLKKWRATQETRDKADQLLSRNPGLKNNGNTGRRKHV